MHVCVSPAGSSSPSGAPVSLPPLSSLGCDRSQLTPPLLWQPENCLEKGQLAPFSLGLPGARPSVLCSVGAPSASRVAHTRDWGFLFPVWIIPETSSLINKGPSLEGEMTV